MTLASLVRCLSALPVVRFLFSVISKHHLSPFAKSIVSIILLTTTSYLDLISTMLSEPVTVLSWLCVFYSPIRPWLCIFIMTCFGEDKLLLTCLANNLLRWPWSSAKEKKKMFTLFHSFSWWSLFAVTFIYPGTYTQFTDSELAWFVFSLCWLIYGSLVIGLIL